MVDGVPCSFMKPQTFKKILFQPDSKHGNSQLEKKHFFPKIMQMTTENCWFFQLEPLPQLQKT